MDYRSHSTFTAVQPRFSEPTNFPGGSMVPLARAHAQGPDPQHHLNAALTFHGALITFCDNTNEDYPQSSVLNHSTTTGTPFAQAEPETHFSVEHFDEHDHAMMGFNGRHSSEHIEKMEEPLGLPMLVSTGISSSQESHSDLDNKKAQIIAHPCYPRLVLAYTNCCKFGAPPEVMKKLEEVSNKFRNLQSETPSAIGAEPELDNFMDVYSDLLQRYYCELVHPFKEAINFFESIEMQLNQICQGSIEIPQTVDEKVLENGCLMDEDDTCSELDYDMIDPLAQDQKLKEQLLRKYSGYIQPLKQQFLKKRKKGKLPKQSRQQLLDWWSQHYKWPYPTIQQIVKASIHVCQAQQEIIEFNKEIEDVNAREEYEDRMDRNKERAKREKREKDEEETALQNRDKELTKYIAELLATERNLD